METRPSGSASHPSTVSTKALTIRTTDSCSICCTDVASATSHRSHESGQKSDAKPAAENPEVRVFRTITPQKEQARSQESGSRVDTSP